MQKDDTGICHLSFGVTASICIKFLALEAYDAIDISVTHGWLLHSSIWAHVRALNACLLKDVKLEPCVCILQQGILTCLVT
ncbi:hypothetical protein BVRB_8g195190 isoform A [Beta vulgaris subsp. vulgaris]|nr:hypothetical protein BVRB_8g195190 isoform A [Beta vulgaris subsp. vulgaris]